MIFIIQGFRNMVFFVIFKTVRLQEHRKAVVRNEIEKSRIVDHVRKEKGNNLLICDEVTIIDRE